MTEDDRQHPPQPPEEDWDDQADACDMDLAGLARKLELGRLVTPPPAWAVDRPDIAELLHSRPGRLRMALTGGLASGKSTVAEMTVGLGAAHIDFDILARQAVEPGSLGLAAVIDFLGREFLTAEGALDRPKVGAVVFRDPELKAGLEKIIHPLTWDLMGRRLVEYVDRPAVVISVPLLFEAGLETFFSPIVMVFAGADLQLARLLARQPGLTSEAAQNLIDNQWPAPPKVMGSSFVINNCGSLENTARQVEDLWPKLLG